MLMQTVNIRGSDEFIGRLIMGFLSLLLRAFPFVALIVLSSEMSFFLVPK